MRTIFSFLMIFVSLVSVSTQLTATAAATVDSPLGFTYAAEFCEERVPTPYPAPHVAIITITVRHGRAGDLLYLLQQAQTLSHENRLCLRYDICRSSTTINQFILYEVWTSKEAHDEYLQTLNQLGLLQQFTTLIERKQEITATKIE